MQRAEPSRRRPPSASRPIVLAWVAMFALAFALRAGGAWVAAFSPAPGDPAIAAADAVASNLARGSGFTLETAQGLKPTAAVPPVVPWLMSLAYRGLGHRPLAMLLLRCAIGALVPLLLAAFGRSLFGDPVGRWSGWLATVHPLLVVTATARPLETALAAVMLLALNLSAGWVRTPRAGRALGAGLTWGGAALTHAAALPLPALVAAWGWRPLGLALDAGGRARQLGLLLLGFALVVGPWTLRNALAVHAWIPVSAAAVGVASATPWLALTRGWAVATLPLVVWGVVCSLRGGRRWFQALPLPIVVALAVTAAVRRGGFDARVPIEALAALYAVVGFEDARRRLRARARGLTVVPGRRASGPPASGR